MRRRLICGFSLQGRGSAREPHHRSYIFSSSFLSNPPLSFPFPFSFSSSSTTRPVEDEKLVRTSQESVLSVASVSTMPLLPCWLLSPTFTVDWALLGGRKKLGRRSAAVEWSGWKRPFAP